MARVYVSSTIADLKPEREAVMDWLITADHQPVHSYRPNSDSVRKSCLDDIDGCDLYVLILGHRYGFQPEEDNAERLSITHLEFRRAKDSGVPRIALLRTSVPNISLSDLQDASKAAVVLGFIEEVRSEVRPAEFSDLQGLIHGLSTGVQSELDRAASKERGSSTPDMSHDPRFLNILDTLTNELERKNKLIDQSTAETVSLRGQIKQLEDQLKAAIARTLTAAAQPDAGKAEIAAVVALEAGDTRPAEALLKKQERAEVAQMGASGDDPQHQRAQAAALAREQGALAMGHDVRTALAAFQRAVEYEPNNTWTHFFIGDLQVRLGDLSAAMRSFREGLVITEAQAARDPANTWWQRDHSVSHEKIGNVLVAQGDGPGALAAYRKALVIREALAARDPTNTLWQRDLSVNHNKIGEVLVAQGDGAGALTAYRKGFAIAEALAARDPASTEWQRDLSVSHDRIGDVLEAQGDGPGALAQYRKGFAIREALAARDPASTEWQRDLSVSHNKIGNMLLAQGDEQGALAEYRKDLAIAEALAARDAANTQWQHDLSISHERIGDVLVAQDDWEGALIAYRKGFAIAEALAARDPANTGWQRGLSVSHDRIGDVLADQGDSPGALVEYRKGFAIRKALSARDPANTGWQRDLSVSHNKIGNMLLAEGDEPGALAEYRKDLAIAELLAARDAANTQWQYDVALSCAKLGTLANVQNEEARRKHLLRGRQVLEQLKREGRLPKQNLLDWFDNQLQELP